MVGGLSPNKHFPVLISSGLRLRQQAEIGCFSFYGDLLFILINVLIDFNC